MNNKTPSHPSISREAPPLQDREDHETSSIDPESSLTHVVSSRPSLFDQLTSHLDNCPRCQQRMLEDQPLCGRGLFIQKRYDAQRVATGSVSPDPVATRSNRSVIPISDPTRTRKRHFFRNQRRDAA